ncbi:MAG: hypothetical protein DSZ28_03720 [Thiothrix sp.]|nr:MAG: hypothetical protein DSZ28_03720 [Thiothrix sp.]
MKKTLIATAVAAVMAAPAAMADIILGGQLQAEIVNASGDGVGGNGEGLYLSDGWERGESDRGKSNPNKGNASSFFVKGSHDIGNGLTGLYKLNINPKFGDDFGTVGTRDAFIGLKGGFGTVLMGTIATPYKSSTVKWDPFLATFMQARGNGGMTGAGHNGYANNVVAYANKFGPATFVGAIAFDESKDNPNNATTTDNDGDHALTASVNVPVGPVELALAYIDTGGINKFVDADKANGGNNIEAIKFGVKYGGGDVSPLTLAAQYETIDAGGENAFDQIYLTGGYAFGANTVSLSYGITQPDANGADDGDYVALGLNHAFNKSVSALIGVTKSDNADFNDTAGNDDDTTLAGLSMRVKF